MSSPRNNFSIFLAKLQENKKKDFTFSTFCCKIDIMKEYTHKKEEYADSVPVPLREIFIKREEKRRKASSLSVCGSLRCTCGSESFRLYVCAEKTKKYILAAERSGGFSLAVFGRCVRCNRERELFDAAKHGWDGFICKENLPAKKDELDLWTCGKCGGETFEAEMKIEPCTTFQEDLKEEIERGEFSPSDWANAFLCLSMSLRCTKCGRKFKKWLDYEAA